MTHEEITALLDEADTHLKKSEVTQAEKLATDVLSSGSPQKTDEARALIILGWCCEQRHRLDDAEEHFNKAHQIAEASFQIALQSLSLGGLAAVYKSKGNYTVALSAAEQSLTIAESVMDKKRQAFAHSTIGSIHLEKGDYTRAIDSCSKALSLGEELGDKEITMSCFSIIGIAHKILSDYPAALEDFSRALALSEELGNRQQIRNALGNIGQILYDFNGGTVGLEYLERANVISEEIGDNAGLAIGLGSIGGIYYDLGDYSHAMEYSRRALDLSSAIGDLRPAAYWIHNIARIERKLGNLDAASQGLLKTLHDRRELLNSNEEVANTLLDLGRLLLEQEKTDDGLRRLHEALTLANELGEKNTAKDAHKELADAYANMGNIATAFEHLTKHLALDKEIFSEESRKSVEKFNMRVAIADMESQKEVQRLKAEKSESILRLKERDLANTASSLAAQTELLGNFRADLRKIVLRPDRYEPEEVIRQVKAKLKELPCEMIDFSKFEGQFATVHPEYRAKLETMYPELTAQEVKVCMLMHVNLKTPAIARLMCISDRGVEQHRLRIRRKMNLKEKEDLREVLRGIG